MAPHAALATILLLAAAGAQQPPPSPVRVATVERAETAERRQVTGNLRAASRARVAAIEPGRIVEVAIREADAVDAGAVLARIDDRRLRQDLAQARAELDTAKAELEIRRTEAAAAQEDLDAYEQATQEVEGSVSVITLRAARRDAAVAEARVLVAERSLVRLQTRIDRLQIQLEDTVIHAPFAGRIVSIDAEPGEWASAGREICTLVSTGDIEAWLEVPEQFSYAALAANPAVTVTIETLGARIAATETRVIPDVDPRSRRYVLIASLPTDEHPLAPGMSVTAALPTGARTELVRLPSDAVMSDGGGYFVYRVVERPQQGTIVQPVSVELRFGEGDSLWVAAAQLRSEDRVVIEGNERLRPMQSVQVVEAIPGGDGDGRAPTGGGDR